MIEIDLKTAVGLYSVALMFIVGVIWFYTEVTVRRSHHVLAKQFLWRCVFCGYSYLDEAAEAISECPRCHSFNSAGDKDAKAVAPPSRVAVEVDEESLPGTNQRRNPSHRKRPHQRRRGGRRRR